MDELKQFDAIINDLEKTYPKLMPVAAAAAVNFSKERIQTQRDVFGLPFVPRKTENKKTKGRKLLIKTGTLIRDIQVIQSTETHAVIGTTQITVPYAKAQNEGFKGTVTVPEHSRIRKKRVRETYTDRKGVQRNRTSVQNDDSKPVIIVRTHNRKMNLPARTFLAPSLLMDGAVQNAVEIKFTDVLSKYQIEINNS